MARWLREVANVRVHGDLKERPIDRWQVERPYLQPYHGVVNLTPKPHRRVPMPVESLQHPLSVYDALVVQR